MGLVMKVLDDRAERMDDHLPIAARRLPCHVEHPARGQAHMRELLRSQLALVQHCLFDQRLADARQLRLGGPCDTFDQLTPRAGVVSDEGFILSRGLISIPLPGGAVPFGQPVHLGAKASPGRRSTALGFRLSRAFSATVIIGVICASSETLPPAKKAIAIAQNLARSWPIALEREGTGLDEGR